LLNYFDYQHPATLDEAVKLLTQPGAKAMAGGTDLIVSIRSGMQAPGTIVDIKGIKELKRMLREVLSGGEGEV